MRRRFAAVFFLPGLAWASRYRARFQASSGHSDSTNRPGYEADRTTGLKRRNRIPVVEEGHVFDLGDRSLRVVHLPGHTPGSIGLIDERARILFTGDVMYESDA